MNPYTIQLHYDTTPDCPFRDWDCEPPLLALRDSAITAYGDIPPGLPDIPRQVIAAHANDILEIIGYARGLRQFARDYTSPSTDLADALTDSLRDHLTLALSDSNRLAILADIYNDWLDIPALRTSRHGYVQSSYTELLIVATPEFIERTGAPITEPKHLTASADLFAAWAFGDVYGYTVTAPDGTDAGSCFGFYGDDHTQSGLLEHALNDIQCHHREATRNRYTAAPYPGTLTPLADAPARYDILEPTP